MIIKVVAYLNIESLCEEKHEKTKGEMEDANSGEVQPRSQMIKQVPTAVRNF